MQEPNMDKDCSLWSINSTSSFLYSQQSQECISLESPQGAMYASDIDYDGFTSDSSFEFPVVSLSQLDARRYLYSNGVSLMA